MLDLLKKITTPITNIVTAVWLAIFYLLIFLPYGLLIKIFIKKSLNLNINKTSTSYWLTKLNNNRLHRQF